MTNVLLYGIARCELIACRCTPHRSGIKALQKQIRGTEPRRQRRHSFAHGDIGQMWGRKRYLIAPLMAYRQAGGVSPTNAKHVAGKGRSNHPLMPHPRSLCQDRKAGKDGAANQGVVHPTSRAPHSAPLGALLRKAARLCIKCGLAWQLVRQTPDRHASLCLETKRGSRHFSAFRSP